MAEKQKTSILFICIENSCRSQMAEGFAHALGGDNFEVYSAGSRPSGVLNPEAIAAMKEVGIDISSQTSKGFKALPRQDFDYVVTMGCQDVCPFFPAKQELAWDIPDPKGRGQETFREVRDLIRNRVLGLLSMLDK